MTILLPFNEAGQWLRGSLHCHSTNSDGEVPPEQVAARYKAEGYDFICVTDHFRPEFNYPITDLSVFNDDVFLTIPSAELHIMATSYGKLWHLTANGLPGNFQPPMTDETPAQYAQRAADAGAFVSIVHPSWYQLTLEDAETITCAHAVEVWNAGCQSCTAAATALIFWTACSIEAAICFARQLTICTDICLTLRSHGSW
ncbi:PHP domain-containing protein [Sutterella wadsworthensis]|uniref:PHP domain-containing protein n=1 Tax=Sutterella wadsworthensis TaxID=40545 RepID=UPI0024310175|nr:hypothetical protein [Sutterella wadsworthensis]